MDYDAKNRLATSEAEEGEDVLGGMPEAQSMPPNALLVYWELYSRNKQWSSAHTIAKALVTEMPEEPIGWIYRSFALHQLGRFREAWTVLLQAARKFPKDWRVAYNAACCACQLGDVAGAWNWVDRAIELGNADVIKSAALEDPRFRPLWARLGQI